MIAIRDRVRFVETDMMGVVHHANYLRWFEMGRVAYLRAAGVELLDLMAHGVIFPITEVHVKYKNSCTFDDEFEVQTIMIELMAWCWLKAGPVIYLPTNRERLFV